MAKIDTGLASLILVAKHYKITADMRQLERAYVLEEGSVDTNTLVQAGRDLKLKVRAYNSLTFEDMKKLPCPAILTMKNGRYIVLHGFKDGHMFITDPMASQNIQEANVEIVRQNWQGEAILFTRRYELPQEESRKFGFRWFIPVVAKYGKYLRSVLFLSLILQLLGLASPFFIQVIIDRVLVHRSSSALDVLIMGMLMTTVFSSWLDSLRSYLFTNITTKMDVALSSRLFRNITALPLEYFSRWQVGDVVARMGEMENLRNFMTGSALTIVLDMFFALVCFLVMVFYLSLIHISEPTRPY